MKNAMNAWWVAIDLKNEEGKKGGDPWSSYEELKARHVVAQGWPYLGDLSSLWKAEDQKIANAVATYEATYKATGIKSYIFINLLNKIELGDIVVAIEGTRVRGIAEICSFTRYVYDIDGWVSGCDPKDWHPKRGYFEYAHCLFPVKWVDWEELGAGWIPQAPARSVKGIRGVHDAKVVEVWEAYKARGFKPCEGLEDQLKRLEEYVAKHKLT